MFKKIAIGLATLGAVALGTYLRFIRPWHLCWGATDEEVHRPMPGDDMVVRPITLWTRAVTIKARPEEIWPWLVQMGQGRGGFYSYTWIENLMGLDISNTDRIIPEFQHLEVGDVIPFGGGTGMTVKAIEPNRSLLLAFLDPKLPGIEVTWVFGLYPLDKQHTRLVTRNRGRWPLLTPMGMLWLLLDPGIFVMTRKMLLVIKQRAEQTSGQVPERVEGIGRNQPQHDEPIAQSAQDSR